MMNFLGLAGDVPPLGELLSSESYAKALRLAFAGDDWKIFKTLLQSQLAHAYDALARETEKDSILRHQGRVEALYGILAQEGVLKQHDLSNQEVSDEDG